MKKLYLILFALILQGSIKAQTFTEQTGISLTGARCGDVAWGDYDNDGDLDILLTGYNGTTAISKIYQNNGNNTFAEQTGIPLTGAYYGSTAWGDYDNDGDLDILLTGFNGTIIYQNNGNNTFTEQTGIHLTGVFYSSVAWGDYDNDGDLDILLTGTADGTTGVSKIYQNNGNNTFTRQIGIPLTGVYYSSVAWGDYDNDGDLDILLTGTTDGTTGVSKIYQNNGNNTFTEQTGISLTGVFNGSVAWGDYDNDGDLDILLTGYTGSSGVNVSKIYRNNGNNTFAEQTGISLTGANGSVAWGDYDNDGDLDILLTGYTGSSDISKIYRNNGNNTFTEQTGIPLIGVSNSSVVWGDYDNDGDLDILLTGQTESGSYVSKIYQNNGIALNASPSKPTNLQWSNVTKSLSWNASNDDHTPPLALTYNIAIGTSNKPISYLSPQADLNNGYRRVVSMGNNQLNTISFYTGYFDSIYYARIQAIDNGFMGSLFSDSILVQFSPKGYTSIDTAILCGNQAQLNVSIVNGNANNLTYHWSPSAGLSNANIRNPLAFPNHTTTYKVNVTASSGLSFADSVIVTVNPIIVDAGTDKTIICGNSTTLTTNTNYSNATSNLTWSWSPSTGLSSTNVQSPTANPITTSDYIVSLSSIEGCTAKDTVKVSIINPQPSDITGSTTPGIGTTQIYSVSNLEGVTYNWTFPTGWTQTAGGTTNIITVTVGAEAGIITCTPTYPCGIVTAQILEVIPTVFTEQIEIALEGVREGSVAWGDYNNDGDLDILLTGTTDGTTGVSKIYRNNGDNTFAEQTGIALTGVFRSSVAWGDYDNDGDLDILLTGTDGTTTISKIYRNNGNNTFTEQTGINLVGVRSSSVAWGDYDNDGDLDILMTGSTSVAGITPASKIYRNNGNNSFSEQTEIALVTVYRGSVAWGDYDNDGALDILLTGLIASGTEPISKIYRNNGDNSFTEQTGISLTGVYNSSVAWGDYDNDGDLDILLTGTYGTTTISKIYRNNGDNTFAEQTGIALTGVGLSSVAWGDYDNDGDLDILLTGSTSAAGITPASKIYRNNGNNSFTEQTGIALIEVNYSPVAWGDYDNDGDLDILLTGTDGTTTISKIYRNNGMVVNTAPSKPTNLLWDGLVNKLTWNPSTDNTTPSAALTYNIAIGTNVNPIQYSSPHADLSNGYRRVVAMGNSQLETFSHFLKITSDYTYYAKVQAIDNGFKGSLFSDSIMIKISPKGYASNDTILTCGDIIQLDVSIINGNANNFTYQWSPSYGLSDPNIRNPIASPNFTTTYKVTATATTGLTFTDSVTVTVNNANFNPDFSASQTLFTAPPFVVQYTNTTPNLSNFNFTWNFGDGTILNSNNPSVFHTYSNNGLYSVLLIATHAISQCTDTIIKSDYIYCTGGIDCSYTANILQTGPINRCQGDSVLLSCNTDNSYSYQWKKNGTLIQGATTSQIYVLQTGTYTVTINQNSTGCSITSSAIQINFSNLTAPQILALGTINPCSSDSIKLYTASSYNTFNWSTGATMPFIYVTQSGSYILTVTDANGCSAISNPYTLNTSYLSTQSICMVGVDVVSGKNMVVWNKPVSNVIDSFYIYRETTSADVYAIIGAQPYASLSTFIDNTSNPNTKADRYKITAVDTCGSETPLSDFHKTNHLTINQGVGTNWNLIWDGYEGFSFPTYNIYRGTSPSNMSMIGSIQSNLTSYTDDPGTGTYYYQIEVVNPINCNPSKSMNSSLSNIVITLTTGIVNQVGSGLLVDLYPNPNNGDFTLSFKESKLGKYEVVITSVDGKIIHTETIFSTDITFKKNINIENLSKGLYFVNIRSDEGNTIKRIVVQ